MFNAILRKISIILISVTFGVVALGMVFLITQTQQEQRQAVNIDIPLIKEKKDAVLSKTIHINNFPVKTGYITSRYGMRKHPFTGKRSMHRGLDIAAKKGTSIYPVGKGKVIFSGRKSGYGKVVVIEHSSAVVSRYSHLHKSLVKVGQLVKTTDVIAQVGNTGRSTGPHLHLEIAFNGKTTNPRVFLSREVASSQ